MNQGNYLSNQSRHISTQLLVTVFRCGHPCQIVLCTSQDGVQLAVLNGGGGGPAARANTDECSDLVRSLSSLSFIFPPFQMTWLDPLSLSAFQGATSTPGCQQHWEYPKHFYQLHTYRPDTESILSTSTSYIHTYRRTYSTYYDIERTRHWEYPKHFYQLHMTYRGPDTSHCTEWDDIFTSMAMLW